MSHRPDDNPVALVINTDYETKVVASFTGVDFTRVEEEARECLNELEKAGDKRIGCNYDVVVYSNLTEAFNELIEDNVKYTKRQEGKNE